ncbi:insulin-like growth factor-binding complex acid labile subunit [Brachionus plicatilis]|uniref:Insulin-like growth factor-binding complex acid labile subunit n=1 Tax=Brachionus plicatilis TaxID=10195 RepID=A0A3M7S8Y8_BRAPC|nr:insulin-like growth factor-binding complex acid labile subunit [Brachionus plicatilis]
MITNLKSSPIINFDSNYAATITTWNGKKINWPLISSISKYFPWKHLFYLGNFCHFVSLYELNFSLEYKMLSKQKISEFYSPNEKSLIVVNQNYQLIDEDAFDGLTDVEILNFSSNQLQKLNSNLFVHLPNLKKLILSFNSINFLPAKIFSSLKVLEQLEMTNCNLSSIDSTSLNGLTNLKRIILAYNDLAFIQPNTFSDLIQLEVAVFSFNKLETIHPDTFTNQKNLKRLNLKANNLKKQVILSANSLSSVDDIFTNSSNLQRLIMHSNKISQLTKFSFKGLDKIFSIDIANNLIEKIDDEAFCEMPTLKYLDMSRNCLKSINKRKLLTKSCLRKILDFNQITFLKPDILANLDGLLEISCNTIDVNNMKELQEKIALEILQRLSLFTNRHKVELFSTIQPKVLETLTKTLIKIIEDIYQDLSSHINNFKPFVQNAKCFRIRFLSYIISIFKNWSKTLKLFCQYFDDFSGLEIALKYLNCADLKKNILLKKDSDSKYSYMILVDIYGDLLNLVYNSILNDQKLKKKFSDFNCFDSLIETAETLNNVSDLNFKTYLIISEIIDDELNLKRLKNIKQVIEYLVTNIKTCVNRLNENGQNVDRCPLVADENKHQNVFIDNVLILEVNNNFYYLTDFLNVLYNFAINDEIKFDIYQTYSMKCMIKILVQKGNKYEKEMSLKLLCQLCFDKRVLKDAESDRDIFLSIKILSKQKPSSETENLIKNAKSIIWLMQKNSISYEDPRIEYGLLDMRFRGMDKNMIDKKKVIIEVRLMRYVLKKNAKHSLDRSSYHKLKMKQSFKYASNETLIVLDVVRANGYLFCSKVYQFGELKNLIDKSNKAKYTEKSIPCVNEFFFSIIIQSADFILVFLVILPKGLCLNTCFLLKYGPRSDGLRELHKQQKKKALLEDLNR